MTALGSSQIRDAAHLKVVPDGTVISWLRIPGDHTSEAVAFVRRETDPETGKPVIWITPGGWSPHTIESAGVTFPCSVVRWGEFHLDTLPASELPMLTETIEECVHGGTWAREKALECAARVYQGRGFTSGGEARDGLGLLILSLAGVFEAYLDPPELTPELPTKDCTMVPDPDAIEAEADAVAAYRAWEDRDRAADGEPTSIIRGDSEGLR
jgi:hypothetical protein